MAATGLVAAAPPAAAYPSATVSLIGHGFGHGRGMGQWGAFGYAYSGSTWQQIVTHFYSGAQPATTTPTQEGTLIRVALTENNDNNVIVTSASGFTVDGHSLAGGQAVLISQNGAGAWNLYPGAGCAGGWGSAFATGVVNPVVAPATDSSIGDPNAAGLALQLCLAGGNLSVRGSLEATYNSNAQSRTVNVLPLEDYIVGVVPNESPAYWGQLGSPGPQGYPWGFQELEAQAVAARSYVMSALGSYGGYADTCDLTCQTYRGLKNESPITDAATLDTQGWVMEESGRIMTTEYSASSGGYTAPGTFPAVPDNGDAVCPPGVNGACNPNHDWKASIPVASIESTWPQLGTLAVDLLHLPQRIRRSGWPGPVHDPGGVGAERGGHRRPVRRRLQPAVGLVRR